MVFRNGNIPWNKGIPRSEKTRKKISKSRKGKKYPKASQARMGKHYSPKTELKKGHNLHKHIKETNPKKFEEWYKKISESKKGNKNPTKRLEVRKKISKKKKEWYKTHKSPQFGKCLSEDTKKKISKKAKERFKVPENHPRYGKPSSFKGKRHTKETIEKIRLAHKGKMVSKKARKKISETRKRLFRKGKLIPTFKGKTHTKKTREKMVKIQRKHWKDPKFQKKIQKSRHIRPNKPEQILIELIKENKLPFKYCGDFSIWIDGKNPDFINVNGEKQVIEFFGDYWHKKRCRNFLETEWGRKEHYKKWGFDCLVIWEHNLDNLDSVKNKILEFCGGN